MQEKIFQKIATPTNICFIGLMGAGKTTMGRALAKRLEKPFFDSDHEIETRTGVCISVIFEHEGEVGFRRREAQMIKELTQHTGIVLSTGGGAVLCAENRAHLQYFGTVIYLHAQPRNLWLRTQRDKNRPLLHTDDAYAKLEALYTERDPLYRACAHIVIETGAPSARQLIEIILTRLALHRKDSTMIKQLT